MHILHVVLNPLWLGSIQNWDFNINSYLTQTCSKFYGIILQFCSQPQLSSTHPKTSFYIRGKYEPADDKLPEGCAYGHVNYLLLFQYVLFPEIWKLETSNAVYTVTMASTSQQMINSTCCALGRHCWLCFSYCIPKKSTVTEK